MLLICITSASRFTSTQEKMVNKKPYFHLSTTLLGVNFTDTFLLANHHGIINCTSGGSDEKISLSNILLDFQHINSYRMLNA
jgi:hypothetical protein